MTQERQPSEPNDDAEEKESATSTLPIGGPAGQQEDAETPPEGSEDSGEDDAPPAVSEAATPPASD